MVLPPRRSLLVRLGWTAAGVMLGPLSGGFSVARAQSRDDASAPSGSTASASRTPTPAPASENQAPSSTPSETTGTATAGQATSTAAPVLLVLGDSLSAEYGLQRGQGWVALLEARIRQQADSLKRKHWQIVNASISGETTVGGRNRLPGLLRQHRPALVLIELGGNDGLRGLPLQTVRANLRQMIGEARAAGAEVLLIGMQMPPNYGPVYARQFQAMYQQVADESGSALVPFLLEGFGNDRQWFQSDGIHPTAAAQPKMLDNVWPVLQKLL